MWNGDSKVQKQVPVCNLEVRIFHYKQKLNISTISFISLPYLTSYFNKIYPVVHQLNVRAETLADMVISCKFMLRTQ
jgi:hypothetical protein